MSMPSLHKQGGVFLAFPGRQAARVLGARQAQYITRILMRIGNEIPIAINTCRIIQERFPAT
jgi:hypothetical protein